jgi:hypothetical protein
MMSEITTANGRDARSGRFVAGNSGNGGRKPGSRNKLGEQFLSDLRDVWQSHGIQALEKCAEEEPGTFCKIVSSLLPKSVDINLNVDAQGFVEKFRNAVALLGNDPPPARARRPLPGRLIEHHDG